MISACELRNAPAAPVEAISIRITESYTVKGNILDFCAGTGVLIKILAERPIDLPTGVTWHQQI
jgi:hypothetical protein